jgi:ParB/Sulfiredoxin domain
MTDINTIPPNLTSAGSRANRLALWKGNVRKTGANEGIAELAASIASHGLLQSLVVRISGLRFQEESSAKTHSCAA